MDRLILWLSNQKLKNKLLVVVAVACSLLLFAWICLLQHVCDAYNKSIYATTAQLMVAYSEQIEEKMDEIEVITLSIIGDDIVQNNLHELGSTGNSTHEAGKLIGEIKGVILNQYHGLQQMRNICVFLPDESKTLLSVGGIFDSTDLDVPALMQIAEEKKGAMGIYVQDNRFFWVRQVRQKESLSLKNLGVLIGEIDINSLMKVGYQSLSGTSFELNMSVYVEDACIYTDNEQFSPMPTDGWRIQRGNLVSQHSSKDGWTYVYYTPYRSILESVSVVILSVTILSVVIMLLVLLISQRFLKRILQEFELLVGRFDAYAKGIIPKHEDMVPYHIRKDEIGYLNRQFEHMVYAHKQLEDENYQRMLLHQEAQYKQLQHQIRPHFIFNTLSMISWTAYQHGDDETATLIKALSEILRAAMSTNDITVKLSREKKLVENYMRILCMRYKNKIEFQMSIPPELDDVSIPYMTLQPILENAVNYGLEDDLEKSIIRINGWVEENKVILTVEDNGPGVESDLLHMLTTGERKPNGNGIGLLNVQKRIQLVFSEEYGLSFHRIDGFTQVRITIPKGK